MLLYIISFEPKKKKTKTKTSSDIYEMCIFQLNLNFEFKWKS